ncbi:MAG: sulfur carrier protein [Acidobacteriota bacterium]|nr:sulfur carrier protein [Acidobacteriota bacterium]
MKITINGKETNSGAFTNLEELVAASVTKIDGLVVELNGKIVRKNQWKEQILKDSDKIEMIQFVGGG